MSIDGVVLAFDVGERRIGVAKAAVPPRIAQPITTLEHNEMLKDNVKRLIETENPAALVVGRPRNSQGEQTAQTRYAERWVMEYLDKFNVPIYWQDESLTSVAAEAHLSSSKGGYNKGDVDALAASIILTDYLETN